MNSDEAIRLLEKAANQIDNLKKNIAFSKEHTKWASDTLYLLEEIFGRNSRILITFAKLPWEFSGTFIATEEDMEREKAKRDYKTYLKRKGIKAVYEGKDTPKEASEILKIVSLIENSLRKAIRNRPTNEKEVQNALEILFIGASLEFTREKERILYSSKTYQPDFVFDRIGTVVETKFCDRAGREKEIIGEINDYILAFKTKYPNLIFVVYDVGMIRDVNKFKESFEQKESVVVIVIKH
jgi:hypothetical protein